MLDPLLGLREEALVKEEASAQVCRIAVAQEVRVDTANLLVGAFLLHDFLDLLVVSLIACGHLLGNFVALELVNGRDKLAIVLLDFIDDAGLGHLTIRMHFFKLQVVRVKHVLVYTGGRLQLLLTHVGDVVGRLCHATSHDLLKNLLFFDQRHSVVVVAAPLVLHMVLDVGVIVATLSCAIMDDHSMQVILHVLQANVLVGEQFLLLCNLVLQALDLILDKLAISFEHLLNDPELCLLLLS